MGVRWYLHQIRRPSLSREPQIAILPIKTPYNMEGQFLGLGQLQLGEKVRKYCRATLALWFPAFSALIKSQYSSPKFWSHLSLPSQPGRVGHKLLLSIIPQHRFHPQR